MYEWADKGVEENAVLLEIFLEMNAMAIVAHDVAFFGLKAMVAVTVGA